jgi:type IV secretory pathway TrbD component
MDTTPLRAGSHPVYKALHRPLTVCGVDRRLFFLALLVGVATFNLFYSFVAGLVLFAALYGAAWFATGHDPQLLRVLLRAGGQPVRYDGMTRRQELGRRW